jgi:hypothetical protein
MDNLLKYHSWPTCCFREALINADVISSGVEKPALGSAGINQTFLGIFIRHHDIGCPLVAIFDEWAPRTYTPVFLMHRLLYLAIGPAKNKTGRPQAARLASS